MNCTVVFDHLGPYHVARLSAAARGAVVTAIELGCKSKTYGWFGEDARLPFRRVTLLAAGERGHRGEAALVRRRLPGALAKSAPEIVFTNGWGDLGAPIALRWAATRCVPAVIMSESSEMDHPRVVWREAVKRRVVACAAAALVGGSRHAAYLEGLGLPADCIFRGYDAVDNDHFARGADLARLHAEELRQRLRLPRNYFLVSSRFEEKKNLPLLLRAFRQALGQIPASAGRDRWHLLILGTNAEQAELVDLIHALRLSDRVQLRGFQQYDEVPAFLGLAKCFVHASTIEQWGLVVNEAMAAGLPVLVSNRCGCAPELVSEGRNGFTFDPRDEAALAALLARVASGRFDLAAMGRSSRELIAGFSPEAFGEGFHRAAQTAIARPRSRPGLLSRLFLRIVVRAWTGLK